MNNTFIFIFSSFDPFFLFFYSIIVLSSSIISSDDTKLYQMVRLQFWISRECGVTLYSQVYSDLSCSTS